MAPYGMHTGVMTREQNGFDSRRGHHPFPAARAAGPTAPVRPDEGFSVAEA